MYMTAIPKKIQNPAESKGPSMANEVSSSSVHGSESGWIEAQTSCNHLTALCSDLTHIPTPDTHCNRCHHPKENWLCLSCKVVLCGRWIERHMLEHFNETRHCLALSYSDLSVWCYICDAYLDAQVILPLRPVYETAYLLKFGEAPPSRSVEYVEASDIRAEGSTSGN